MVTANELRIGNLVFEIHDTPEGQRKDVFKVAAINSLTDTLINEDDNITQVDYCEPIHITPDILKKAGFEEVTKANYVTNDNSVYKLGELLYIDTNECCWKTEYLSREVKYLHDLQNLYFTLTGEELFISK